MKKIITILLAVVLGILPSIYANFELTPGVTGKILGLYVSGQNIYAGIENDGVRYSNNNGASWSNITNNMGQITVNRLTSIGSVVFAATTQGVYKTTNNGSSWTLMNNGLNTAITSITAFGSDLYAGTLSSQVYKSTNSGDSWVQQWNGAFPTQIKGIVFYNNKIFVASGYVYVSTNAGASWTHENAPTSVNCLHLSGSTVRAGAGGGYINTNPTGGWLNESPWGNFTHGFAVSGTNLLHGTYLGVFLSTNNGAYWQEPPMLWGTYVYSMAQTNDYILAGSSNGIYRKSVLSLTGINQTGSNVPEKYTLDQNYPNPFNPSTTIRFGIPQSSDVNLDVYNMLGERVSQLVSQKFDAGEYEYNFDASSLPSGAYYYKLTAGNFTDAKKMILVK